MNYDVLVIGAGPAGYVAAIRAAQLGQTVGIIEKEYLGGVCLNVGCIPSKSLLKNAEVAHTLRERGKEFGFSFDNLKLDYGVALKRSRQVSNRLTKGVGFLMKKNKIEVHMGTAKFTAANTLEVTDAEGKTETHTAKNIIVATGAQPLRHPRHRGGRQAGGDLQGSHPAGYAAQVGGDHRRRRDRDGICHHLAQLRRGCDHRRDARPPGAQ